MFNFEVALQSSYCGMMVKETLMHQYLENITMLVGHQILKGGWTNIHGEVSKY